MPDLQKLYNVRFRLLSQVYIIFKKCRIGEIRTGQKGYRNFLEILFARSRHSLNFVAAHKLLANQVSLVLLAHSYRISPDISDIFGENFSI